jgi:hypothetical protein
VDSYGRPSRLSAVSTSIFPIAEVLVCELRKPLGMARESRTYEVHQSDADNSIAVAAHETD